MRRFVLAVVAGVLAEAALLAAVGELPPHHPAIGTTAFRVVTVGAVGGFVAATATDRAPRYAAFAASASVGVGVGAALWWTVLYGDTVGVLHHLHYALATVGVPFVLVEEVPRLVAAGAGLVVAVAFALGGVVGGVAATRP
ncbi:hypothetical protein [Halobacterium litoreum]|uniref:Uncharacterized protein n=1 Tax=Halobacterium litoreum TaxID=2039234 RepID=A0ABD5NIA5_9EURY|nr:hypothetical protein [Halobacterium litoreum]UHH12275.1 hypothetical protein LT972_08905 [Halobacterium litoreum]